LPQAARFEHPWITQLIIALDSVRRFFLRFAAKGVLRTSFVERTSRRSYSKPRAVITMLKNDM